jgi:hypothetical protein
MLNSLPIIEGPDEHGCGEMGRRKWKEGGKRAAKIAA